MKIDIVTLFPDMFAGPFDTSMLKKAQDIGAIEINIHNLRKWTKDRHKTVDDRPFGGGPGMVLMIEPIERAIEELKAKNSMAKVIMLSPQGQVFSQNYARKLAKTKHIILLAGHYEGFDERIRDYLVDDEISIGKYVLTGGEIPAMVMVDAVSRLLPGVLEGDSAAQESFSDGETFDYPVYTRPSDYKGWMVPEVLLTGDHKKITAWRREQALKKTQETQ